MRICLINNLTSDFGRGGAAVVMEEAGKKLKEEGNEVVMISSHSCRKPEIRIWNGFKNFRLPSLYADLERLPAFLRIFWHLWDMFDLPTAWKIEQILKEEKIDFVITHNLKGLSYLTPRAIRRTGSRHEHVLHDIQLLHPSGLMFYGKEKVIESLPAKIYSRLNRALFGSPEKVLSPSGWLLKLHTDRGFFKGSEREVRPNFPSHKSDPLKRDKDRPFRFLFIGQLEKHKGVLLLIEAFKSLRGRQAELWIAGQGTLERQAEKLAGGRVEIKFLGWDAGKETDWMRQADCLVVPSLCYENSPSVIYKAKAAGLPVIASDLGGIPELVGKGSLFRPEAAELEEKLRSRLAP